MSHPLFDTPEHTIGELYSAVFAIHDADAARAFYSEYVTYLRGRGCDERYAEQGGAEYVAKDNIGWIFGEGMPQEDIDMWTHTCGAAHPIFGSMADVTPESAFAAGAEMAKAE